MKTVMIIAAHPDDEILGAGGTMRRHVEQGDSTFCLILGEGCTSREGRLSNGVEKLRSDAGKAAEIMGFADILFAGLPDNRFDSVDLLDIVKVIEAHIKKIMPDIIYTHSSTDLNIDHVVTHRAVLTACRPVGDCSVKEVYAFETLSSTEWSFGRECFRPNVFIDIEATMDYKLRAIKCYTSELREYPHPRSIKGIQTAARRWGMAVHKEYAEAFELIRKVTD